MPKTIVITPVKDSPETTLKTIEAVCQSDCPLEYIVFNDFSQQKTKNLLIETQKKYNFSLVHLEELTNTPSPNYKLVLQIAQKKALENKCHLIILESDVIVKPNTIRQLLQITDTNIKPGLVGAITVDASGKYNFPYQYEKIKSTKTIDTPRSLSFSCTLLSYEFLKIYDFKHLAHNKDWFDVTISRIAKKNGFHNYLAKGLEVLHQPHSSRPWKNLKYTNPILYYFRKFIHKRDRI
ncbi:MAG: glycosyltransferase [Mariniphaga sp.]|nr:glycosyltransferase [Mariniphaga sp.]MDD4425076.1 glycosyltransferase [Mariniphaga sp.]